MSLPTNRTTTTITAALAVSLSLGLASCSQGRNEERAGPAQVEKTAETNPWEDGSRLTGEDIHEDRERFAALADQSRTEFSALTDLVGLAPLFHSLHLCTALYTEYDNDRDVQTRYEELLDGFSGQGYVSSETGQHWVDFSIDELCPDLETAVAR